MRAALLAYSVPSDGCRRYREALHTVAACLDPPPRGEPRRTNDSCVRGWRRGVRIILDIDNYGRADVSGKHALVM